MFQTLRLIPLFVIASLGFAPHAQATDVTQGACPIVLTQEQPKKHDAVKATEEEEEEPDCD